MDTDGLSACIPTRMLKLFNLVRCGLRWRVRQSGMPTPDRPVQVKGALNSSPFTDGTDYEPDGFALTLTVGFPTLLTLTLVLLPSVLWILAF